MHYHDHDIRCGQCRRKLGEGSYLHLAIKCPRCGTINQLRASTHPSHACERPTAKRKDAYGDVKKSIHNS